MHIIFKHIFGTSRTLIYVRRVSCKYIVILIRRRTHRNNEKRNYLLNFYIRNSVFEKINFENDVYPLLIISTWLNALRTRYTYCATLRKYLSQVETVRSRQTY